MSRELGSEAESFIVFVSPPDILLIILEIQIMNVLMLLNILIKGKVWPQFTRKAFFCLCD